MLDQNWRKQTWADIDQHWDVIVIGGGITGAGIFNMAAQKGLKVLLLEAKDFSFGTSSRSSKLVHGGIRYLKNHQFDVVRESVHERERLIRESDGLVDPIGFIFPSFESHQHETNMMKLGVIVYDLMAPKWQHRSLRKERVLREIPALRHDGLEGGVMYHDTRVDDSRLVLRVIMDGIRYGGSALNYAKVEGLCKTRFGYVQGVMVQDKSGLLTPDQKEIKGTVIINATGPWSDELRHLVGAEAKLRPLRGSHLIFSHKKLPIHAAVTMVHPRDNRALFAIPWENRTLIGTTDLDHTIIEEETRISQYEVDYLLEAVQYIFKDFPVSKADIISTFAGLRPVINTGASTPSKESRAHGYWEEDGLVTISGGKLTIFRVMAADVLNFCRARLPNQPKFNHHAPCFIRPKPRTRADLSDPNWLLMAGRLGSDVNQFFKAVDPNQLKPINPIPQLWGELAWAAQNEAVLHLDDLLLRRVRLGLLLPNGGLNHTTKIQRFVQGSLGWTDQTWEAELNRYQKIWKSNYYLPED